MNKYDKILDLFTGNDPYRDFVNAPFRQGGYVYATDSRCMVRIDAGYVEGNYEHREKPDAGAVMNRTPNRLETLVTMGGLKETYGRIPDVMFKECDACEGIGKVDFEFEYDGGLYCHRDDCPVCDGAGYVQTSEKEKDFRYGVRFLQETHPVKQEYLLLFMQTLSILGAKSARLVYASPSMLLFDVDSGVQIVMAGYFPNEGTEEMVVCYKEKEK